MVKAIALILAKILFVIAVVLIYVAFILMTPLSMLSEPRTVQLGKSKIILGDQTRAVTLE